ncbi:hypothetical protein [Mesorhizobium sp. 131-2-5]|uniref:hypothetical protein n=1 Tax=Mesorhizobium sp. 131-2-5 TaxID=2744519 RepID=UPI001AEFFFF5|nr:hypothetical protein [Mesorhizobium sp. 131-2-5]
MITGDPTISVSEHVFMGKEPCGIVSPSYRDCQNMKEAGGGFEDERYWCAICSNGYFLDYEALK